MTNSIHQNLTWKYRDSSVFIGKWGILCSSNSVPAPFSASFLVSTDRTSKMPHCVQIWRCYWILCVWVILDENAQINTIFVIFILILEKCWARMCSPISYWDWRWKCALQPGSIFIFKFLFDSGPLAMVISVENKKIHWTLLVHEAFLTLLI